MPPRGTLPSAARLAALKPERRRKARRSRPAEVRSVREGTDVPWRDPSSDLLISTNTPSPRRIAVYAVKGLNFRGVCLIPRLALFSGVRRERLGLVEPTHSSYGNARRHDAKHFAAAHQRFPLFAHMQPSYRTVPVSAGAEFESYTSLRPRPGLGSFASSILGRPPDLNETLESSLGGVIGHSAKFGEIQGFARWLDTQQDAIHNGRAERTASARRAAPPRKANMKLHAIHRLHAEPLEANRVTKITANENHNCYSELVCGCFCRREYVFYRT